jgi:NADPH:quinone reductase-like Zn-dependent oxidoreductase
MKAMVYTKYGPPDVLELKEVDKPEPHDDEVLIKVFAASVNPAELHLLRADPFFARFYSGLLKPKNTILGADISGIVESVGRNIKLFHIDDEVFGDLSNCGWGGFAQYVCARENALALKPVNLSFDEAAAVPLTATTALQGLRNKGLIHQGQKVLINGASGGVGTFAVQIAKSFGTHVTGVCSTRNLDLVRSIGADQVIDYTQIDFTRNGQYYDLIFDAVGNRSVSDYKRALTPNGICAIAGFTSFSHLLGVIFQGSWVSITGSKKIGLMETAKPNHEDLVFIKELIEAGKVKPVIDSRYPLSQLGEAFRYLEKKHARGKVVVTIEH